MRGKGVLKNIISTLFSQVMTIICSFIIPSILIRTYGSDVNGLVTSITQFLAYITLLESGLGPVVKAALYQPIAKKDKKEIANILKASEKFFKTISYIFICYIVILCIIFPIIMREQFSAWFTVSLVIIIAISTFAEYYFGMTYKLYLQAEQKTYVVSNIQTITIIMNAILVILLVFMGASIQVVKLISALVFALRPILQNIYVKKKYHINLKEGDSNYKIKQKWEGLAQHIAGVIHSNTDVTVITFFCDIKEVSVYSVYMLVVKGIKQIVSSLTSGVDSLFGDMLAKNEKNKLNRFFGVYELVYFGVVTIIFACTLFLIVPFVNVYTKGITDVSYYRPVFAYLIVLSEFVYMVRLPYINLTYAAGHFKETRIGAWIEAFSNIILSIIFVNKLGIIGVAIGTLIAMLIRTVEFMYHSSKKILERNIWKQFIRWGLAILELLIIAIILGNKNTLEITSYTLWILYALKVFAISSLVVIPINMIIYKKDVKELYFIIKTLFKKESNNDNIIG